MEKIINSIKAFYEKYFKSHCPDCDGVMDAEELDLKWNRLVYVCRECGERWM